MSDLINKTFEYRYEGGPVFHTSFLDGDRLRWTQVEGPNPGSSAEESYASRTIGTLVFLQWVEASGMAINQVVDLANQSVTTGLVIPADGPGKPTAILTSGTVRPI